MQQNSAMVDILQEILRRVRRIEKSLGPMLIPETEAEEDAVAVSDGEILGSHGSGGVDVPGAVTAKAAELESPGHAKLDGSSVANSVGSEAAGGPSTGNKTDNPSSAPQTREASVTPSHAIPVQRPTTSGRPELDADGGTGSAASKPDGVVPRSAESSEYDSAQASPAESNAASPSHRGDRDGDGRHSRGSPSPSALGDGSVDSAGGGASSGDSSKARREPLLSVEVVDDSSVMHGGEGEGQLDGPAPSEFGELDGLIRQIQQGGTAADGAAGVDSGDAGVS